MYSPQDKYSVACAHHDAVGSHDGDLGSGGGMGPPRRLQTRTQPLQRGQALLPERLLLLALAQLRLG